MLRYVLSYNVYYTAGVLARAPLWRWFPIKHYKWHRAFWTFLSFFMRPYLSRRFNYKYSVCGVQNPVLVISNHVTDWDPFFIGVCFPQHLYFVASDHIFRWGWKSKIIRWLVAPIPHLKSVRGFSSAREILRRLKGGANVCLFAEGNRTWDGVTCDFLPSAGKLARISGATLVTFRITGGYFTQPRWGRSIRKGRMKGGAVGVYTHEQLKAMTPEQINEIIANDIYEDAYARQHIENASFTGSAPAESLETLLCICPECGRLGTMRSHGRNFTCSCGFSVRYGDNGFFTGDDVPFDNVTDWNAWQDEKLSSLPGITGEGEIMSDEDVSLIRVLSEKRSERAGVGKMSLDRKRLRICGIAFPLEKLTGISLIGRKKLSFTCDGESYELSAERPICFKKYLTVLSALAENNTGLEHLAIT